ncbi:long-chain fatty acid--CoA ligase [Catenulispora sp. NF23]|uniref:Long-chain fatty acid--CoA ligase n=1 Tax=Catenulispora pinistramenti TaxID=2705254 RepID=A0ABS5KZT3_9ACTN|nr:long-chain fatty acid--CoA ligase [Catenulispora pinistramenti]MBS2538182.1 long-chain fatty acid--CoA ligase [Catenulispora pinistramenti]MBS2551593.1 long-chain fatty acid--CoA ligase [Catenulispora pinistramenti]
MTFNLASILRESRYASPGKPLCHSQDATLTYEQVDQDSGRVAATLLALGLERGDRVAVQLPNLPEFLLCYFGILKAGLVMVPLNPLLKGREIGYQLRDSGAKLLVAYGPLAAEAIAGAAEAGGTEVYVVNPPGNDQVPAGTHPFAELLSSTDTGDIAPTEADDTAVVLYTSGTTGKPKGAELTHFQLYMNCTVSGALFGVLPDDVSLAVLPLFHVFGLSSVLNVIVRFGGTLALVPRFEITPVLDAMEKHRCTIFSGVPTMYFALLHADTAERDLSTLRVGCSGGAAMPGEVIRAFEAKFPGVVILEGYGLSETASTVTFNISADQRRVGSVGKAVWGVEVRVIDDAGQRLPPGPEHVGEFVIRGHTMMAGYWRNPEATAEVVRDGWFHTGDLGYADEDGYFYIVDRKKDLVIRGGFNVYPREIEEVLYAHPAIAEAAVIGRADERLGEEVVAYIALKAGAHADEREVIEFCRDRLAPYKYPREVRILSALPIGPTGKILKKELRT